MTCPECGAEMRPLFTGVYCPEEDRHGREPAGTPDIPDLCRDLGLPQPDSVWNPFPYEWIEDTD